MESRFILATSTSIIDGYKKKRPQRRFFLSHLAEAVTVELVFHFAS